MLLSVACVHTLIATDRHGFDRKKGGFTYPFRRLSSPDIPLFDETIFRQLTLADDGTMSVRLTSVLV